MGPGGFEAGVVELVLPPLVVKLAMMVELSLMSAAVILLSSSVRGLPSSFARLLYAATASWGVSYANKSGAVMVGCCERKHEYRDVSGTHFPDAYTRRLPRSRL